MTAADYILFAAQFVGGLLFALVLQFVLGRRYEIKGHTWATVVWGVAQTGLLIAVRLYVAPLQHFPHAEAAVWWSWRLWTLSFCASGVPIIVWQFIVHDRNVNELRDLEVE